MKKVIFDIGHPAQVHNFKHIYWELEKIGWKGLFVTKDKEICIYLLEKYKLPFVVLSENRKGLLKKILFLSRDISSFSKIVKEFKPNIVLNRMSLHSTLVCKFLGIPQISIADTEKSLNLSFLPDQIFTATSFKKDFGSKHLRYRGNIELFYLHKNRFQPDKDIFKFLKVRDEQKYAIIRFVSWDAHHDIGQRGFSYKQKIELVQELSKRVKLFISSEDELPEELEQYQISIPAEKIHNTLYFASLYIGEGGTMASESAMVGTPAIYVNSLNEAGVFEDEERAGLLFRIVDGDIATQKALEIIDNETKEEYTQKLKAYLQDKIDITSYMVWIIENYPDSIDIIRNNFDYQLRFK